MLQLREGGRGATIVIGNDLLRGQRPQAVVERGVWQGSRLMKGGQWALLGCTVSPGFEFEDYETGERAELIAGWPEFAQEIKALTRVAS
jgi:predicted cupin superfamily sugar epimerase